MKTPRRFETEAIHAGMGADEQTGALVQPIYSSTTYAQTGPGEHKGYEYSRTRNPTRSALEQRLAALEGARYGAAFASGLSAINSVLHTLQSGDHVVCSDDVYGGTYRLFNTVFGKMGVAFTFVDLRDLRALEEAINPRTRLVWFESPTNPLLTLFDVRALATLCRSRGVLSVCDNTFMTPFFQRPLALGVDVVVHSTTKYINGHGDCLGGFVGTSVRDLGRQIYFLQNAMGAVPSPSDCYMVLRGLKSLPVRMERHASNALAVAQFLSAHPAVSRVLYPGLPSHPQHVLAREQMSGFGGMVTFELKQGLPAVRAMIQRLSIFTCAESLGCPESLLEHPATMTHASVPADIRARLGITDGLVRVSVGLEHIDDLLEDLRHALDERVS